MVALALTLILSLCLEKSREPFIPTSWKICNSDSDCVETQAGCCSCSMGGKQTAINKKYLSNWKEKLEKYCKGIACPAVVRCKPGKPRCVNSVCKFVLEEGEEVGEEKKRDSRLESQ